MHDLIDRQAAIDVAKEELDNGTFYDIPSKIEYLPFAQPTQSNTHNALTALDCISRQAAIEEWKNDFKGYVNALNIPRDDYNGICAESVDRKLVYKEMEYIDELPSAQSEIIRCKDCLNWIPGYITDQDDFIPPKCGKYQQMVGHSSDDYCSYAERRNNG